MLSRKNKNVHNSGLFLLIQLFICALKFCGSVSDINKGRDLHAMIIKGGLEKELLIENALVDIQMHI